MRVPHRRPDILLVEVFLLDVLLRRRPDGILHGGPEGLLHRSLVGPKS